MIYATREEVLAAVELELADPKYSDMTHHQLHTYNEGCQGPLCRKRQRDYGRERYRIRNGVTEEQLHKPTIRTQWDELLNEQLRTLQAESRKVS